MLDQDSVLEPKLAGKPATVDGSIRHISQEDFEAYANGRLASGRLSYCQTHLDSCEACRAELEDIRTLQTELSSFTRPETNRRGSERRGRRRGIALPLTASAVAVLVAAGSAILWWRHGSPRVYNTSAAAPIARAPAPLTASVARSTVPSAAPIARTAAPPIAPVARSPAPPATRTSPATADFQTRDTRLAEEIAALPDDLRPAVSEAIQHGRVQLPPDVLRIHDRAPGSSAPPEDNTGFSLSGPFGEATSDTRPKFTWQPFPGAIGYTVAIVDPSLRPVQHSPALRATSWRPRRPLARGRTYLWQVTATMHGGSKVVASSPAPSEALLRIIPRKLADKMARYQRGHKQAHLVLGVLYAQAGMLTEGANELRKVPPGDSSNDLARKLLQSLSAGR